VATARSEELRELAQRVADAFPPEVIEVVLTGSVSRGVADDVSDIEMLVVTEEQVSLEEAFELARRAGLEDRDSWGDPATPTRRVSGYLDGQPVETIWWSRAHAEEHFDSGASAEAIANGIALRTGGLLARWQERLQEYPDELAMQRIEAATERWGGFTPAGLLTILRPGDRLALTQRLYEDAENVLRIIYAVNRVWEPDWKRLRARLAALEAQPERTAERIEEALLEPDGRRALLLMTELARDTVALAPSTASVLRARDWLPQLVEVLR
jgi:predicted nucleotidyltransferase